MNIIPRKLTRDGCLQIRLRARVQPGANRAADPDELASKTFGKFDDATPNLLPCNIWQ